MTGTARLKSIDAAMEFIYFSTQKHLTLIRGSAECNVLNVMVQVKYPAGRAGTGTLNLSVLNAVVRVRASAPLVG